MLVIFWLQNASLCQLSFHYVLDTEITGWYSSKVEDKNKELCYLWMWADNFEKYLYFVSQSTLICHCPQLRFMYPYPCIASSFKQLKLCLFFLISLLSCKPVSALNVMHNMQRFSRCYSMETFNFYSCCSCTKILNVSFYLCIVLLRCSWNWYFDNCFYYILGCTC